MIYLLYELILYLSALYMVPYYLIRGVRYGKARHGIRERLGIYREDLSKQLQGRQVIWIHAVSVGETRAAIPLVKMLRKNYPEACLVLSNVTETGRKVAGRINEIDHLIFFPFDLSWIVKKVLNIISPDMILLIETEIWPNFVLEAKRRDIPVVLVNGRISDRSFPRYRMVGSILKPILECITDFCMQSEQDSRRIRHLGAPTNRVTVTGNLKFDMQPPNLDANLLLSFSDELKLPKDSKIWVAGSTHEGEESQIIEVYQRLREVYPDLFLVLVPRHPERCRQVQDELAKKNVSSRLRSTLLQTDHDFTPGDVLIVDTLGEMLKLYAISDWVFVGGSLVDVGGHNILEAAVLNKPVLYGPHMQNFKEIARLVRSAHAGLQVKSSEDLLKHMKLLIQNPQEGLRIGENGQHLLEQNRGATHRTFEVIDRRLR